jgi:mRNA interferase RelE/StbE
MPSLAWEIEVTEKAAKQIKKLGATDAKRIRDYLRKRIAPLDHPR